jgi:hypothetical protein
MLLTVAVCAPPALSYAPWDVGWGALIVSAISVAAGVACVGVVGSRLRWTADDRAPLRPLWTALIVLGFAVSAAGLYVGFANQAHAHAVTGWTATTSQLCLATASKSPNLSASTAGLGVRLGAGALVIILLGIGGAVLESRPTKPRPPRSTP